jgi:hypothetical protein
LVLPARWIAALFAALTLVLVAATVPARAASAQNLSGEWLNSAYKLSAYQVHMSPDGQTLSLTWGTDLGTLKEGLVGSFSGTLDPSGTAFAGPMHVSAGSLSIGGTMTVAITSQQAFGYPLLMDSYQQDNGVAGTFTLEMWIPPPKVASSSSRTVTFAFDCPGPQSCQAESQGQAGSANVGSMRFSVKPGATRMISLSLNKRGRALLAARHSLRVRVQVVALKQSSTLPPLTTLGTVTLHSK